MRRVSRELDSPAFLVYSSFNVATWGVRDSFTGGSELMNIVRRLSIIFIAISFVLPLWSALYLIPFVQPKRAQIAAGQLDHMFSYENFAHEAGFGRLAICIIALIILFIPFRKGERWAFAALAILAVAYCARILFWSNSQFRYLASI